MDTVALLECMEDSDAMDGIRVPNTTTPEPEVASAPADPPEAPPQAVAPASAKCKKDHNGTPQKQKKKKKAAATQPQPRQPTLVEQIFNMRQPQTQPQTQPQYTAEQYAAFGEMMSQ